MNTGFSSTVPGMSLGFASSNQACLSEGGGESSCANKEAGRQMQILTAEIPPLT